MFLPPPRVALRTFCRPFRQAVPGSFWKCPPNPENPGFRPGLIRGARAHGLIHHLFPRRGAPSYGSGSVAPVPTDLPPSRGNHFNHHIIHPGDTDFVSDLGVRRPRRHIDPQYQRQIRNCTGLSRPFPITKTQNPAYRMGLPVRPAASADARAAPAGCSAARRLPCRSPYAV